MTEQPTPKIPLPKAWNEHVKSAVLHVVALAQYATTHARGRAAEESRFQIRCEADVDRLLGNNAMQAEQLRIVMIRIKSIPARQRPNYEPTERMAILELRAARGW